MEEIRKEKIWRKVLGELECVVSKANFSTWFQNTSVRDEKNGIVFINVPNSFTKEWLKNKYNKFILGALRKTDPLIKDIEYTICDKINPIPLKKSQRYYSLNNSSDDAQLEFNEINQTKESLNPRYDFDNFVVGAFNELAHAAAVAVTKNPGTLYNPLFIYGGVGLGKTHLLQAAGNAMKKNNPNFKIKYITSEKFANGIVESIRNNTTHTFKESFKKCDFLMMDDVQFLAGKTKTREEFFHIFNTLYEDNKQIIFSSDRPPRSIPDLEERLKSRFEGGMMADISEPEYESRVAILKNKAQTKNVDLPNETIEYIASMVKSNIRELEGALNFLSAQFKLLGKTLSFKETQDIFEKKFLPKKKITFNKIVKTVADFYETNEQKLFKKSRKKEDVLPRQIAMFLLREDFNASYPYIGQRFSGRDHTTIIYAYEKINKNMKSDSQIENDIKAIRNILYGSQ
ncbi:MAG: chromosomal replication initiator protein DnaA [Candidatus Tagabacteria bacterium CG10_big_fil_rev_8_21_14_0_10_40_13]|uniref:Chromosomal replication initiator protein DnaA n=3 Tax=Candidatus Tagaibacteriota TaxID=1817918 RepID=A0A2M8L9C6_9BACT|nr:MAG: chromosomal replication initiator protein DnaA [Candidatus Tagabacteria bacterium CG10_big_fil_rev_8_21_14_0_10_40_13]